MRNFNILIAKSEHKITIVIMFFAFTFFETGVL